MSIAKGLEVQPWVWPNLRRRPAPQTLHPAEPGIELALTSDLGDLAKLAPEWDRLTAKADGPAKLFLSFNWIWHWCRHFLSDGNTRLAVVTARNQGALVMVWPLVVERRFGLSIVSLAGNPVSQYGDVLCDPDAGGGEAGLAQAWNFVRTELAPDIINLRKVRGDSLLAGLMHRLAIQANNAQAAPYIALTGEANFEALDERFSAKDRKNRRRKRKRLGELGEVGFRRSKGSAAAVAALTQAMIWKRQWLEDGSLVSTALADRRFDRFFESVLTGTDRPVGAEAFELTLDGKPVAIKVAITSGTYRGMHFTAYDKAYEKCSPGGLLVEEMVEIALADGITTLDFLAPALPYKLDWTESCVAVADYAVPVSAAGRLYVGFYLRKLRPALQKLANDGPAPIRRLGALLIKTAGRMSSKT